jgi:ABC-type glycerol-3-phosphate transport system substrate-binding protein
MFPKKFLSILALTTILAACGGGATAPASTASSPATEDFADAVTVLAETNPKVKDFDVKKIIDNSLVQSAVERGLDK